MGSPTINDLTITLGGEDIDNLLAQELNGLTIQERETVYEEIHGVGSVVEESEGLIQQSLTELERELNQLPPCERKAYDKAIHKGDSYRDYVTSREFRLKFLRCEGFDTPKAAKRLVLYMEGMLRHFGEQVLGRPLYYSDLHPDSQEYFQTGVNQLVHQARDSVGRPIQLGYGLKAHLYLKRPQQLIQVFLYLWHCAIEHDAIAQQRGIVFVSYVIGKVEGTFNHMAVAQAIEARDSWFPIKVTAMHICFHDPRFRAMQPLGWLVMGSQMRQRVRMHYGTHTECMYKLMSFGIRIDDSFPVNDQGVLQRDIFHRWLSVQRAKEEEEQEAAKKIMPEKQQLQNSSSCHGARIHSSAPPILIQNKYVDKPAPDDVILWRGRIYQLHPGNVRMRELLEAHLDVYDKSPTGCKNMVSQEIVHIIQKTHGGRFLTQDASTGFWVVASDKNAVLRVSKAFRTVRSTVKTKKKKNTPIANQPTTTDTIEPYATERSFNKKRQRVPYATTTTTANVQCCIRSGVAPGLPEKVFG